MPDLVGSAETRRYRKCLPSGRNCGQACAVSPGARAVIGVNGPPEPDTRKSGELAAPAMITPSAFHAPPTRRLDGKSAIICGGPPWISTFLSFLSLKLLAKI